MFEKLFISILFCFFPFLADAKIIETSHIAEALAYISQETWFLVDLDNTLFEATQALGHTYWFYDQAQMRMEKGMSKEEAMEAIYPDWVKIQQICNVKPLEVDFIPSLHALQNRGIVVMGLTHRQPPVAKRTLEQVASLGVDFTKTAPSQGILVVPAAHPTLYSGGILFVNDYNKKSDIFMQFISMLGKTPKKVVFIDDRKKNVEELEETLPKYGIDYVGVYYTAIDTVPPIYSRELAQYQAQCVDKILSNEAAALLLQAERMPSP